MPTNNIGRMDQVCRRKSSWLRIVRTRNVLSRTTETKYYHLFSAMTSDLVESIQVAWMIRDAFKSGNMLAQRHGLVHHAE